MNGEHGSGDIVVPASPSSMGLTSDEAFILRDENRRDLKSLREDLVNAQEAGAAATLLAFQRAADMSLTCERNAEVFRCEIREHARRQEARSALVQEQIGSLARSAQRQENTLNTLSARDDRHSVESATPWWLRPSTWRPVLVATVFAVIASAATACATVRMLTPADEVDGGRTTIHGVP